MKRSVINVMCKLLTAAFATLALCTSGLAQVFPSKPIKFVVPFPPGSATDTSARYFGRKITEITGQPVVVDNKPGGNSIIAIRAVQAAPADGYTIFIGSNSPLAVNSALFKQLPYDPVSDFTPLSLLTRVAGVLIVPADSPFRTVADLVAAAKAQPGKINFGYGSAGYHLMGELFNEIAGTDTVGIPFKSATDSVIAVASGNVNFSFVEISSTLELVRSGKIRALAIASPARSPRL
jgi:tripartite-type tricarboxylate transporter receptor subunit TctC